MRIVRGGGIVGILLGLSASLTQTRAASAQPRPAPAPATTPTPAQPAPPVQPDMAATSTAPTPVPDELLRVSPSGLTSDQVGTRAGQTSYSAKAAEENLRGAAARVDAAWAGFLPRLTATARYTRLSNFTPPALGASGNLVGTNAPTGPITTLGAPNSFASVPFGFSFPLVLNNYLLQANITVPISDYFLRIDQSYTAAIRSQDAYRFDAVALKARAASDGKLAFYTWLRARGAIIVATQALNDQRTHLKDAQNQFAAGNANKADVLRAETSVAAAELTLERARNLAELAEKQVRVAIHAPEDERLLPGENLEAPLPALVGNVKQFTNEALASRYEIKSIDANAASARQQASVQRAGRYPTVAAFGDAIYANPNPRRFPAAEEWFGTWDVGAQIVWSPNDYVLAKALSADADTRVSALEAQRMVTRDGIEIEVVQAYQGVKEADFSIDASRRELSSATEAHRVARELFNNGKATSTTLTDAETELTRARLDLLNGMVDARVARIRLEHALGRDTRPFAGNP
jgi:outer membrane protein